MKTCRVCGKEREEAQFRQMRSGPARKGQAKELKDECKYCQDNQRTRDWKAKNQAKMAERRVRHRERERQRYDEDLFFRARKVRGTEQAHGRAGAKKRAEIHRRWRLQKDYGITVEEYDALMAKQGSCCALCGKASKKLDVDHDHDTGKVRGLLCRACNVALGNLGDSVAGLTRALDYLKGTGPRLYEPFTFCG